MVGRAVLSVGFGFTFFLHGLRAHPVRKLPLGLKLEETINLI